MATTFPTSLQDLDATRGTASQPLNSPSHSTHHLTEDDTIEALQAKVGVDSSAVTTSHDYKLSGVTSTDKAVSLTGTETLTNKTLTSPKIGTALLDTNGNEVILTPATASAVNEITVTNAATTGDPSISATGETNVGLLIASKGTKQVRISSGNLATSGHTVPNLADSTFTINAGAQTLTDKTLTSPAVNTPTLVLANTVPTADGSLGFDRTNEDLVVGDGSVGQLVHMGAWKDWTITWTNLTKGSATIVSKYIQVGKMVAFRGSIVFASNTSISGAVSFSLPVTSVAYGGTATLQYLGGATFADTGTAYYYGEIVWGSTTTAVPRIFIHDATYLKADAMQATVPMTWTTTDEFHFSGVYEAA